MVLVADDVEVVFTVEEISAWSNKASDLCILMVVVGLMIISSSSLSINILLRFNLLLCVGVGGEGEEWGDVADIGGDKGGDDTDSDDVIWICPFSSCNVHCCVRACVNNWSP